MKKTKTQKGITLIALIITIVVLMILAVVAISSIQNDGILSYAENAAKDYNQAQSNEQGTLDGYLTQLEQYDPTAVKWTQNGATVTNGTVTLEVGTVVTGYDAEVDSYTGEWAVLGAENGQLLIVSTSNVQDDFTMTGAADYFKVLNNEKEGNPLYEICKQYGEGEHATGARSINVEDINRITGYDPFTYSDYGKEYTFTDNFYHPDGRYVGEGGETSMTETNTAYYYTLSEKGFNSESKVYKALKTDTSEGYYWLDSTYVQVYSDPSVEYGLFFMYYEENIYCSSGVLYNASGGGDCSDTADVRAVVYLESNINIDNTGKIS